MTELLNTLAEGIQKTMWLAPLLALVAGIITSFTPCSLSSVPMVIAYIGGSADNDSKKAFRLSMVMASGLAITFLVFGSLASVIGHFMHHLGFVWYALLGIVMMIMALQIWGVIHLIPEHHDHCDTPKMQRKGYLGAFLAGMVSGAMASHCSTPVMIALLAMAAHSEHTLWGIFLLAAFALGHSILLVIAGTSYGIVEKWIYNNKYKRISKILRILMGVVILLMGASMLYLAFLHR